LQMFRVLSHEKYKYLPDGIFITHAHIGHYPGLMELGREVMDTRGMPVYVLPKMKSFLENNGPWSQLVKLKNIKIHQLNPDSSLALNANISIETFTVPHRDEFSETAGFRIITQDKKYLFIPDINKWSLWDKSVVEEVKKVDIALLDATFFSADELPNRKISDVPHPLVTETMDLFRNEPDAIKSRIYFIHFNHTNPVLWDGKHRKEVTGKGFMIADQGEWL
jgi:pyrroloquinoline quinone biosynthesis protein B